MFLILKYLLLAAALGQVLITIADFCLRRVNFSSTLFRFLVGFLLLAYFYLSSLLVRWMVFEPGKMPSPLLFILTAWISPAYFLFCWSRNTRTSSEIEETNGLPSRYPNSTIFSVPTWWATIVFSVNTLGVILIPLVVVSFIVLILYLTRGLELILGATFINVLIAGTISSVIVQAYISLLSWLLARTVSDVLKRIYKNESETVLARAGWLGEPSRLENKVPKILRRMILEM